MHADSQPEILPHDESAFWRQGYIEAFVDTSSENYVRRIAQPRHFSDGIHYHGYLWECLRSATRITIQRFRLEVIRRPDVFVMADDHSRDLVGAPLWPYPALSVARFGPRALLQALDSLPEDIYVFDSSVSWTLVLTHENDEKRRICCAVGIEK